jgi:hypothetical protein
MNKMKLTHKFVRGLHLLVMAVLLAVALGVPPVPVTQAALAASVGPVLAEGQGPTELLQFTAAGHVLGFQAQGVYVVGSDHMVKVEFADTAGVAPLADQPPSSQSQSQPLGRVTYPHLWEGITLTYERVADGVARSSYVVDPGADVGRIKLRYNVPLELDDGGNLVIGLAAGQMTETAPLAWQDINGRRVPVAVAFRLLDAAVANRPSEMAHPLVGFAVGEYDASYALMIDPTLQWHTFLGGTSHDEGYGIAVDGSGNVYLGGRSRTTWGSPVRNHDGGSDDAFAAKLNASGQLQWNTFLGGGRW